MVCVVVVFYKKENESIVWLKLRENISGFLKYKKEIVA